MRRARGAEALFVGASAWLATLALAAWRAVPLDQGGTWAAGLIAGAAAAGAWWGTWREDAQRFARRADRALGQGGALLAAWEAGSSGRPGPIAPLLAEEVAGAFRPADLQRATLPASAPFAALPVLAGALLALALERPRAADDLAWVARSVAAIEAGMERAVSAAPAAIEAGELDAEQLERLAAALRAARSLPLREAAEREEGLARELAGLRAAVADLERELPRGAPLREALERVEALAGGLMIELDAGGALSRLDIDGQVAGALEGDRGIESRATADAEAGGAPGAGDGGGAAQGGLGAEGAGPASTNPRSALAPEARDGTMFGQPPPDGAPADGATPSGRAAEPGSRPGAVSGGRWWPARHDPLVERWVELRRKSRLGGSSGPGESGQ